MNFQCMTTFKCISAMGHHRRRTFHARVLLSFQQPKFQKFTSKCLEYLRLLKSGSLSLSIYIYTHIHIMTYIYIYIYIYTHMYVQCVYTYTCTYDLSLSLSLSIYIYICIYTDLRLQAKPEHFQHSGLAWGVVSKGVDSTTSSCIICMYAYIYIYIYISLSLSIYIYV